jgi:O-antigen/teichoic acid export membrane protein
MNSTKPLHTLGKQSLWYATASVAAKLAGFLVLPLFTNSTYLPVADFGYWGVIEVSLQIGIILFSLQIGNGVVQYYSKEPQKLAGTSLLTGLLLALFAGAITWIVMFSGFAEAQPLALPVAIWMAAEVMLQVTMALFRAQGQAKRWALLQSSRVIVTAGFTAYALIHGKGLAGVVWASALSTASFALLTFLWHSFTSNPALENVAATVKKMLRFSSPLMIASLSSLLLNAGDRYMLLWLSNANELAVYNLAARFASLLNMLLIQPFNLAWHPLLASLTDDQRIQESSKVYRLMTVASLVIAAGIVAGMPPLFYLMRSDAAFFASTLLTVPLCAGFIFYTLAIIEIGLLLVKGESIIVARTIGMAIGINAFLNLILIPVFDALGAAFATVGAYAFLWFLTRKNRNKILSFNVSGFSTLVLVALFSALLAIPAMYERAFLQSLLTAPLIPVLVVAALWVLRLIGPSDFRSLRTFLKF